MKKGKRNLLKALALGAIVGMGTMNALAKNPTLSDDVCDGKIYTNYYYFLDAVIKDGSVCSVEGQNSKYCKAGMSINYGKDNSNRFHHINTGIYENNRYIDNLDIYDTEHVKSVRGVINVSGSKSDGLDTMSVYDFYDHLQYLEQHNFNATAETELRFAHKTFDNSVPNPVSVVGHTYNSLLNATLTLPVNGGVEVNETQKGSTYKLRIARDYTNFGFYSEGSFATVKFANDSKDTMNVGRWLQPAVYYVQYCKAKEEEKEEVRVLKYKSENNDKTYDSVTVSNDTTIKNGIDTLPTKEGYTLKGWSIEPNSKTVNYELNSTTKVNTLVDKDLKVKDKEETKTKITYYYDVYAVWEEKPEKKNNIRVVYKTDDGKETYGQVDYNSDTTNITSEDKLDKSKVVKTGYKLIGWSNVNKDTKGYTNTYGSGVNVTLKDLNNKKIIDDVDHYYLYAVWEKDNEPETERYLIYMNNEGTVEYTRITVTNDIVEIKYTAPADEKKVGRQFIGWSKTTGSSTADYIVNDSVNVKNLKSTNKDNKTFYYLYAVWGPLVSKVTVTYYENGDNVTGMPTPNPYIINSGECFRIANNTEPTRTGYTFVGWNSQADGKGTNYATGKEYCPTSDMNIYAIWKESKKDTYWVHYIGNEPSGAGTATKMPSNEDNIDIDVCTVIGSKPSLEGYTFKGWNNAADGSGISYSVGQTYCGGIGKNLTLYAQWEKNDVPPSPKTGVEDYLLPAGGVATLAGATIVVLKKKKGYLQF